MNSQTLEYNDQYAPQYRRGYQAKYTIDTKSADMIKTEDIIAFDQLMITTEPKWLYVDALNFANRFFTRKGDHWQVLDAVKKIKTFAKIAKKSGWELKVFIDAATKSKEALTKWRKRREAEVLKEARDIPQGMNQLLGDAFRESGVEVYYSFEADNDDTLAAYAHHDGACIMSGDRDFFRYRQLTCTIYGDFELRNGHLHLIKLEPNEKMKLTTKRNVITPPPKITDKDPAVAELSDNLYRRGAPTALVKRLGNPHMTTRPLRRALYCRRNVVGPVREIFPIWDVDRPGWVDEDVTSDPELDHLLDDPKAALEFFFPMESLVKPEEVSEEDWQNHLYALHAVVYELCALGSKEDISLLQILLPVLTEFNKTNKLIKPKSQKDRSNQPPAYEAPCKYCKFLITLTKREVTFYQEQGFSMPKQCKECKKANAEKKKNNINNTNTRPLHKEIPPKQDFKQDYYAPKKDYNAPKKETYVPKKAVYPEYVEYVQYVPKKKDITLEARN